VSLGPGSVFRRETHHRIVVKMWAMPNSADQSFLRVLTQMSPWTF
jgi:hypothetical protein